jgi:hypothetical protein
MKTEDAVKYVSERFEYKTDPKFLDYWTVMKEKNEKMYGDCDDFSLTSIWKICDENLLIFILNVFILHKYRIYFSKTRTGEKHIVGYANGLYFDNWTRQALSKDELLSRTGHKIYFFFPSPFMVFPLILGLFMRYR